MVDWKTTLTGVVTALAALLAQFNIVLPSTWQNAIVVIGVLVLGFLAKDKTPPNPQ